MPTRGAGSPSPGRRGPTEGDRRKAEIAQLGAERRRADAEREWLLGKMPLEMEQLRAQAKRDLAESDSFAARRELTLLSAEEKRRELAEDDADSYYARTYTFHGDVDQTSVSECMTAVEHWIRRFPGQPVTVQFCTGGGSIFDGMALFGFLRQLGASGTDAETVGLGWVASMGAVLLQAGTRRVLDRDAVLMIHNSVVNYGDRTLHAHEVHDESALIKKLDAQAARILSERSSLSAAELLAMMDRRDVWLEAAEALGMGLCDEVR